jgi:penicillin-binding protein 1A
MLANGFISRPQHDAALAMPLSIVPRIERKRRDIGGYFLEEVRRQLIASYGENNKTGPNSVYDGGLWIRSSLDPKAQFATEKALRDGLRRYDSGKPWKGPEGRIDVSDDKWAGRLAGANIGSGSPEWRIAVVLNRAGQALKIGFVDGSTGVLPEWGARIERNGGGTAFSTMKPGDVIPVAQSGAQWTLQKIPEVSGGMVAEQVATGRVIAMQGGFDSRNASFNRATQAMRQPGSTIKPFVYASALDNGMTPASIIIDGPFCVFQSARLGQKCFRNFDNRGSSGPHTMRWGVEQSRNLMTVRAASQTGMENVVKTIAAMDIGTYQPVLSISLGAGDTTVMKLTNAYAMLANGGRHMTPTLIDYIQDRRGRVILRNDERCKAMRNCKARDWDGQAMPRPPARFTRQALDPLTAYQVVHILEGVVQRGTATVLRDLNRPLFGKTGTSSGPTNVWFVGGSADIVAGVYLGYDQPRSLGGYAQGGTVAAPIFKQFAQTAFQGMDVVPFRAPAGIRMVRIDRRTGRKVFGAWPGSDPLSPVIWEAFKPESEPVRSIRRDELKDKKAEQKDLTSQQGTRQSRDSQFLDRTQGIY